MPKLEISVQTSFESELQRKFSEISQNFQSNLSPEPPLQLPPIMPKRRQSDHRPSLSDRRRHLRKAQTLPNLVFDETDELALLSDKNKIHNFKNPEIKLSTQHSATSDTTLNIENENFLNAPKSSGHSRPLTPYLPLQKISTVNQTSSTSGPDHSIEAIAHLNPYHLHTRLPSFASSKVSNRFESLLRHRSFLKTAASTMSHLGVHSRKGSKVSAIGKSSGKVIQTISDHSNGVNCLELSEDRSLLVSGGEDGVLRLWSTFSTPCECIGVLVGHEDYITCCTIYRLMVISGSADRTLKLWSIEDGNCLMTLLGHTAFINRALCVGTLLLSSSFDGTVRIWALTERLTMIQNFKNEIGASLEFEEEDQKSEQDEVLEKLKIKKNINLVQRQIVKTTFGGCLHILKVSDLKK